MCATYEYTIQPASTLYLTGLGRAILCVGGAVEIRCAPYPTRQPANPPHHIAIAVMDNAKWRMANTIHTGGPRLMMVALCQPIKGYGIIKFSSAFPFIFYGSPCPTPQSLFLAVPCHLCSSFLAERLRD